MSTSVQIACDPVRQSLAALRAGQENFARFITELFTDFENLTQKLCAAEARFAQNNQSNSQDCATLDPNTAELSATAETLRSTVAELEEERRQLEEELENVRTHSASMAQVIEEQKRQMAEENAGWTAELRQLRRILDKQATWISQQKENSSQYPADLESQFAASADDFPAGAPPILPIRTQNPSREIQQQPAAMRATGTGGQAGRHDAVLGSVLSQFELLQRDVARRRDQNMHLHAK